MIYAIPLYNDLWAVYVEFAKLGDHEEWNALVHTGLTAKGEEALRSYGHRSENYRFLFTLDGEGMWRLGGDGLGAPEHQEAVAKAWNLHLSRLVTT